MTFKNRQWAVTKDGLELLEPIPAIKSYVIEASRLTETRPGHPEFYDWPLHMAEKEWVILDAFNEAYSRALEFHKDRYYPEADPEKLEASIVEARRLRRRG